MNTAVCRLRCLVPAVAGFVLASASLSAGPDPADGAAAARRGAKLFQTHCTACHGLTLPSEDRRNLNDGVWHTVATPEDVAQLIDTGIAEKGMPGFKALLRPAQRTDLAAYILSLPKAPVAAPSSQ